MGTPATVVRLEVHWLRSAPKSMPGNSQNSVLMPTAWPMMYWMSSSASTPPLFSSCLPTHLETTSSVPSSYVLT